MSEDKHPLLSKETNASQPQKDDCPFLKQKSNNSLSEVESEAETTSSLSQTLPSGHRAIFKEEDKEKCPYFKMQQKGNEDSVQSLNPAQNDSKKIKEDFSSSSEDEEGNSKRPKGGCPFLPSDRKRNPGLVHLQETYSTYYLSKYAAYLESDNLMSLKRDFSKILYSKPAKNRRIFEKYPIYLKHTLFYDEEVLQRMRNKDIVERFFVYDKFKERGNRLFNKQRFDEAIFLYERALSCFKWLELKDEPDEEGEEENKKSKGKKERKQNNNNNLNHNLLSGLDKLSCKNDTQIDGMSTFEEEKKESTDGCYADQNQKGKRIIKKNLDCFKEDEPHQEAVDEDEEKEKKKKQAEAAEYKNNAGEARDKIKNLISSRADELGAQERQREEVLQRMRAKYQKNKNDDTEKENDIAEKEFSDKQNEDGDDSDREGEGSDGEMRPNDDNSDKQSLSVEGFEEEERNFSSSEEELDIDEIQANNKHPDETAIIMDEAEKKQLIAQEAFIRNARKEDKEFRQKFKLFITNFTDENVVLHDGENLTDANDIDLRQSMLVSVYLSLGVCYLNLGNLHEAMDAFEDARKLHRKGTIPLLRMVQCRLTDKSSTYQQLLEAESWMKEVFELKKEEKIYSSGAATLVVMNIRNHQEFFQEISAKLSAKIQAVKGIEKERLREFMERVVELNEIEAEMIEKGVITGEDHENSNTGSNSIVDIEQTDLDEDLEEQMANIMEGKYYTLLETQMYENNKEKMIKTKKNLAVFQETLDLMRFYRDLDFKNYQNNQIMKELVEEYNVDMTKEKNIKRFKKLQIESMKDAFNDVQHNFSVYKWALDEYMQRRKVKQEKLEKKQQKQSTKQCSEDKTVKQRVRNVVDSIFSKSSLAQLVIVVFILYFLVMFLRAFPVLNTVFPLRQK